MSFGDRRDRRQLYARDLEKGRIVYLAAGEGDAFKPACDAGRLVCPLPGCADPRYIAVAGDLRRHHFRHRASNVPPHDWRAWNHLTGKQVLAQHLQERHRDLDVRLHEDAEDGGDECDLVLTFSDRPPTAVEVQYGRLASEEWRERHAAYAATGRSDVWIFGHLPPHFRRPPHPPGEGDWVVLGALSQTIADDDVPLYFLDPDRQEIATVLLETGRANARLAQFSTDPIVSCEIVDGLLLTPSQRREAEARAAREARQRRTAIERRPRAVPAPTAVPAPAPPPPTSETDRPRLDERRRAHRAAADAAWEKALPIFLEQCGLTAVPEAIAYDDASEDAIPLTPAHWHARLVWRVIQGRIGETFSLRDAAAPFVRAPADAPRVIDAVRNYLFYLRRSGYLHFENASWEIREPITVLADLSRPPSEQLVRVAPGGPFLVRLTERGGRLLAISRDGELLADLRPLRDGGET